MLTSYAMNIYSYRGNSRRIGSVPADIWSTGCFLTGPPQKMTKYQITCKSPQKSSKCQNFLRVWHLVIFRADQSKKPPCRYPNSESAKTGARVSQQYSGKPMLHPKIILLLLGTGQKTLYYVWGSLRGTFGSGLPSLDPNSWYQM